MPKRPIVILAPLLSLLVVGALCWVLGEILWFREVGYLAIYGLRLLAKVAIGAIVTITSAAFLLVNLVLATQWQSPKAFNQPETTFRKPGRYATGFSPPPPLLPSSTPALPLHWLLPLALCLCLLLLLLVLHFGQVGGQILWDYFNQQSRVFPLPERFRVETVLHLLRGFLPPLASPFPFIGLGLLLGGAIALLLYPRRLLTMVATGLSLVWGIILSAHWDKILQYFTPTPFTRADPVFGRDISFYIFALPFWELLEFWLVGLFGAGLLSVALVYLLAGESLSQGGFQGFSQWQKRHLCGLGAGVMLWVALGYWLSRYELLYSSRGAVYGASYTDIAVSLPVNTLLSVLALLVAAFLLWETLAGLNGRWGKRQLQLLPLPILAICLLIATMTGLLLPTAVQRFVVQPNELAREQPYLRRTIALTREAFDLNNIEVKTFNPEDTLTAADLQKNDSTVRNIRLWDTRPLLQTNRQLQQIRPYYKFFNADIDRYTISSPQPGEKQSTSQQVLISARELDYNDVPKAAQTWVNEHLVYTHGYGFTLSPVNRVAAGGLPYYFVKDIGVGEGTASPGNLTITSRQVRSSLPISSPRIYYGEITNTYVMTNTRMQELDYPSGNDNAYNVYDGRGGVSIGQTWQRWLYAIYLKDWQMLFTRNFTPQSKLLFRRNINQRIRAIAPFLTYDHDPYLVVASAPSLEGLQRSDGRKSTRNYLYWMVDAYTVSDRYPYAAPTRITSETGESPPLNYIRNSVKVVIDAYNGSVHFYVANSSDPIIQTWARIFPGLFQPFSAMPETLQRHIRFPIDLFTVQSERLLTYHMTDPQVFYNREDQWQVPTEIYGSEPRLVEPYYLITKLSTGVQEEFVLLLPFTPRQRTNLTAWLGARSDGNNYGKALLYTFPKQELVYGTEQIEARINQDPVISQQISLWNRQGSRAIQGNLLVIPINQSLLYVEPLYLEATQNSLPTLVRVIVAYANQIVMAESLEQSLRAIFAPEKPATPVIVRPVQ
jgi:uncharacterized membrane protein (UPF0182 family)